MKNATKKTSQKNIDAPISLTLSRWHIVSYSLVAKEFAHYNPSHYKDLARIIPDNHSFHYITESLRSNKIRRTPVLYTKGQRKLKSRLILRLKEARNVITTPLSNDSKQDAKRTNQNVNEAQDYCVWANSYCLRLVSRFWWVPIIVSVSEFLRYRECIWCEKSERRFWFNTSGDWVSLEIIWSDAMKSRYTLSIMSMA